MIEYSKSYLDKLLIKKKKKIATIIVLSAFLLVSFVMSIIFVNLQTEKIFKIIDSIILTILGWIIIYLVLFDLLALLRLIVHVKETIYSKREKFLVKVLNISNLFTITKGNKGYCLSCKDDKREYKFYYHEHFLAPSFKENDVISIDVKNNFIISCEVKENE